MRERYLYGGVFILAVGASIFFVMRWGTGRANELAGVGAFILAAVTAVPAIAGRRRAGEPKEHHASNRPREARHDGPPTDRDSVTPEQSSSSTATMAPTLREAQVTDGDRFEISWTGKKSNVYAHLKSRNVFRQWFGILGVVAVSALLLYLADASGFTPRGGGQSNDFLAAAFAVGTVMGISALAYFPITLFYVWDAVKHARASRKRSGWSLSVGSDGITTTDAFRRTVTWDQIAKVSLRFIEVGTLYGYDGYDGLVVRFADDAVVPQTRPAGLGDNEPAPNERRKNVPLCVLGPMTEHQRFDLATALIHHAGERWDAKAYKSL